VNMQVWFYEHSTRFDTYEKRTFPRIGGWGDVYHHGRYDTFELVQGWRRVRYEVSSARCEGDSY